MKRVQAKKQGGKIRLSNPQTRTEQALAEMQTHLVAKDPAFKPKHDLRRR